MYPYEISALTYLEAGFSPLPAIGKLLKVKGASGRHPWTTKQQIEKWTTTHGPFNVALRLPRDVIGIDIDEYKGDIERLRDLESIYGTLPMTWNSDSRGGQGGKLLYRVPSEVEKWQSNINGITIVQHTHRYVMAMPSYNKESDSTYKWYYGLSGLLVPDYQVPEVSDLTWLPDKWIDPLKKENVIQAWDQPMGITNEDLDAFNEGPPCRYMKILTEMASDKILAGYDGNLHDTTLSIIGVLITAATDGHRGVQNAIDEISGLFLRAPRSRDLASEWKNLLEYVLARVDIGLIDEVDNCELTVTYENDPDQMIKYEIALLLSSGMTNRQIGRILFGRR